MGEQKKLRVLNVEDSPRDAALLQRHLSRVGYDLIFERVDTPLAMRTALREREWDVILGDYAMPEFSALGALALLRELGLDIPFIIISGTIGEALAVQAMRAGASDYLIKGELTRLVPAIERELEEAKSRQARRLAEATLRETKERAEHDLRASEERYRQLFESNPDPTFVFDLETLRFVAVNEAAVQEYGYSREELLLLTSKDLYPPAERAAFIQGVSELPNGSPCGITWKHEKKDGTIIDVEVTRRSLLFAAGRPA